MYLRAATYNIHACIGADRHRDPERILRVLRDIDADLLALQEVGGALTEGIEQTHYFARELGMEMILGPNLNRNRVPFGNALLVKGKVRSAHRLNLSVVPFERRGAIDGLIETAHGDIRVIATHLGLLRLERRVQIGRLALCLGDPERKADLTVVLGDFNIFGRERSSLKAIGAPMPLPKLKSFPARRPLMSLDRLWTIPNAPLTSLRVYDTPLARVASDHLPLVGEIAVHAPATVEPEPAPLD